MVFIKKYKNFILLSLIIILGLFLRFFLLGSAPSGYDADEAAFGYNAYSILTTGKDEYGNVLPLVLKSFGDYKGALYAYLSIPFVWIFGLTPFAGRFASSLISVLTVILVYLVAKKVTRNNFIALLSSLMFAISPWGINIARVTGDVTLNLFLLTLMTLALLKLEDKNRYIWIVTAVVSGVLAVLSSQIARIYVVLIPALILMFFSFKGKIKDIFKLKIFYITVILVGFIFLYSLVASVDRLGQVSIFSNPKTELVLEEQIREDQFSPVFLTRVFHNKIVNYTRTVLTNYGEYFTLDFLALNGGYPTRERVPATGLLFLWQIPILLFGIYFAFKSKNKEYIFLVVWFLLLTIPSAFTFDEIPNMHRTIIVLPMVCILMGIGLYEAYRCIRGQKYKFLGNVIILAFILIAVFESLYYGHQYFIHQNNHQPWYRGFAYQKLVDSLQKYYPKYEKVLVTKGNQSPYIYILFFGKYDPAKYQSEGSPRDLDYKGFGKYYFVPQDCPLEAGPEKTGAIKTKNYLYVNKGSCPDPSNSKLLETIYWGDNTPAFKIFD